jgi:hypothetical protein
VLKAPKRMEISMGTEECGRVDRDRRAFLDGKDQGIRTSLSLAVSRGDQVPHIVASLQNV